MTEPRIEYVPAMKLVSGAERRHLGQVLALMHVRSGTTPSEAALAQETAALSRFVSHHRTLDALIEGVIDGSILCRMATGREPEFALSMKGERFAFDLRDFLDQRCKERRKENP